MLRTLTLECSLKPFETPEGRADARSVCRRAWRQWDALGRQAERLSVLIWASDGSEILQYSGDRSTTMEWARYIGCANPRRVMPDDPEKIGLHSRAHLYRDDTALMPYSRLAEVAAAWRETAAELGKPVRVGIAFDPGGEFAPSEFKYKWHPEICLADTMGKGSFVCCYGVLHADSRRYAGFPKGIPEGTTLGAFLGRQARHFSADLGFDYIWFSNGFGFGMETWKTAGPLFDGEAFFPEKAAETRDKILGFWRDFRTECPDLGIETRGTNLGTATDLASDATPLRDLYAGGFQFAPPPNSPWAALNGDFGLEMMGYMTRIAELPSDFSGFPFRFYVHDPWWLNSPWLDRYGRQPHDIYLPLALSRLNAAGEIETPSDLEFLTIDDSYGRMPDACPNEVTPHILTAWETHPSHPGPLVWLYPFDELHDAMFAQGPTPERLFHVDWLAREAINDGLPLNTVVSTRAFASLVDSGSHALDGSILFAPTPFSATEEDRLLQFVDKGGRVLLYGPLATPRLLQRLGLEQAPGLEGLFTVTSSLAMVDGYDEKFPASFQPRRLTSGGPMAEQFAASTPSSRRQATARFEGNDRALAAVSDCGRLLWNRAPLRLTLKPGAHLPTPQEGETAYPLVSLLRDQLATLGWSVGIQAESSLQRHPIVTVHRHDNGWFFSGFCPDTTVGLLLRTPYGAPLFLGSETSLRGGYAVVREPRAWRHECRAFVEQERGRVSCIDRYSGHVGITRRFKLEGLEKAVVRFFAPEGFSSIQFLGNPPWNAIIGEKVDVRLVESPSGSYWETAPVSGALLISW